MTTREVLVIAPFRKPTFRKMISSQYPIAEPLDSAPLSVAAVLEKAGWLVTYLGLQSVFDSWNPGTDVDVLRPILDAQNAEHVVFASDYFIASRSTATVYGIALISSMLRELHPRVSIGVVGRLATTAPEVLLDRCPDVDYAIVGEAEPVIAAVLDEIDARGAQEAQHPSLRTRDVTNDPASRPGAPPLDDRPVPAWHLLDPTLDLLESVNHLFRPVGVTMRTSAGCKFACRFCAGVPDWLEYRTKPIQLVREELDAIQALGSDRVQLVFLEDEIFTRDMRHVHAVADELARRSIRLEGLYTHSSLLSAEAASAIEPVTRMVFLGLDSADDAVLKEMRKGQRFSSVLQAADTARGVGLATHLEWIIGSPPETVGSLVTTLNAIVSLLATGVVESINTYVYCAHPGTEYASHASQFGIDVVEGFEYMQESGGFPAHRTSGLSQQQIFTAYLMSQLAISEVLRARSSGWRTPRAAPPARHELVALLERMA